MNESGERNLAEYRYIVTEPGCGQNWPDTPAGLKAALKTQKQLARKGRKVEIVSGFRIPGPPYLAIDKKYNGKAKKWEAR